MQTKRDLNDGSITVWGASSFSVRVSEDGCVELGYPERKVTVRRHGKIQIELRSGESASPKHDDVPPRSHPEFPRRGAR